MGMYDTIADYTMRCPRCGEGGSNIEIQTKDLTCTLTDYYIYKKDDKLIDFFEDIQYAKADTKLRHVDAIVCCRSTSCLIHSRMTHYLTKQEFLEYPHGSFYDISYPVNETTGYIEHPGILQNKPANDWVVTLNRFKNNIKQDQKHWPSFQTYLEKWQDWSMAIYHWRLQPCE